MYRDAYSIPLQKGQEVDRKVVSLRLGVDGIAHGMWAVGCVVRGEGRTLTPSNFENSQGLRCESKMASPKDAFRFLVSYVESDLLRYTVGTLFLLVPAVHDMKLL